MEMPEQKERNSQIVLMREQGCTYSLIATRYGICVQRAQRIVKTIEYERTLSEQWPFASKLSNRTRNALQKEFGDKVFRDPRVLLRHGRKHLSALRNVGKYSLREIDDALTATGIITAGQEW